MKKLLRLCCVILSLAATMSSCQREETPLGIEGDEVSVTISAKPNELIQTRSNPAGLRYILEVLYNGELYLKKELPVGSDGVFSDVRLIAGKEFTFVCWADYDKGYYNVDDFKAITMNQTAYSGDSSVRDAFCGKEVAVITGGNDISLEMKRPVSQVNIKAIDYVAANAALYPKQGKLIYKSAYTKFNALTSTLSDPQDIEYSADLKSDATILTDYVFASVSEQTFMDVDMKLLNADNSEFDARTLSQVPLRANYRTIIQGNIFTKGSTITCLVQDFDSDDKHVLPTVDELNQRLQEDALLSGSLAYSVATAITGAETVLIPASMSADRVPLIDLSFPATVSGTLTIKGSYTGKVYLSVKSGKKVVIDMPDATVYLVGSEIEEVFSTTAAHTLVVGDGSKIVTINVAKGNVDVYGTVDAINRASGNAEEVLVNKFNSGANITPGAGVTLIPVIAGTIKNVTTGISYGTVKDAVKFARNGDVIELQAGEYKLETTSAIEQNQDYFLNIASSITLRGVGEVTIYGATVDIENGVHNTQSLVFVKAPNVTLENITFMPIPRIGPNKTIEVLAEGFKAIKCKVLPNTKMSQGDPDSAGSIYFNGVTSGTVSNCYINMGTISFDGVMSGTFNINGNTFDAVSKNDYPVFSTPNWGKKDVMNSKAIFKVTNNTFKNVPEFVNKTYPVVSAKYGTFMLSNNIFPFNGSYWQAYEYGQIYVNYNGKVSTVWNKDRTEPISWAVSNNKIEFKTATSPNNNWYSWHGRKAAVNMPIQSSWTMKTALTVDNSRNGVRQSVWVEVVDNMGAVVNWAILAYKIDESGNKSWEWFDNDGAGSWIALPGVSTDSGVYEVKMTYNEGKIEQFINGTSVKSYVVDGTVSKIKHIIFNSYSYGNSYETTWSYPTVQ